MRGFADNNFPLFEKVSGQLRSHGVEIISPHEWGEASSSRGQLMTDDLLMILQKCDGIICLPGWQASPGACAEVAVCFATEKPMFEYVEDDQNIFGYRLEEASTVSVTVPRENQYKQKIPLIGLCGFAQSGKDTTASYLVRDKGWTRVAFADALRDVLYALNPIAKVDFSSGAYDPILRVQELIGYEGWDAAKVNHEEIRKLLQRLGTEAGRDIIDNNLWVGIGENKIEAAGTPVVVTDCRFPNELAMVRRRNGKLIWINRPGVGAANAHASEHSITEDDCDIVLENDGSEQDLFKKVEELEELINPERH